MCSGQIEMRSDSAIAGQAERTSLSPPLADHESLGDRMNCVKSFRLVDQAKGRLGSRLPGQSEQPRKVALPVEAIVVHRVTMLGDLAISSPVAERVRGDAEILGGFLDAEITIEFVHLWNSQPGVRPRSANTNLD